MEIEFNVDNSRLSYETVQFVEHVVVTVTLEIEDTGRRYAVEDFYEYRQRLGNNRNDMDLLVEWLSDAHPRRGDIEIQLTSPQGSTSTLLPHRDFDFVNDEGYDDWPFMSVHFWGENPHGTWTLRISYKSTSGSVRASGVNMKLYGTWKTPDSVRAIPEQCHEACARGCWGETSAECDVCADLRLETTLECVEECPNGYREYTSYCLSEKSQTSDSVPDDPTAENESEGGSKGLNVSVLLSSIAGALILVFFVVVVLFVVLITRQHYCKTRQASFSRLRENIASV